MPSAFEMAGNLPSDVLTILLGAATYTARVRSGAEQRRRTNMGGQTEDVKDGGERGLPR